MGRKNKSVNRPILPDSRYNSVVVSKFVSRMMLDGKKATTIKIVYEALDKLKEKTILPLKFSPINTNVYYIV